MICNNQMVYLVLFLLFFKINSKSFNFDCSPGCSSKCITNYTCNTLCSENYDQDNSCQHCTHNSVIFNSKYPVFINNNFDCIKSTNRIDKMSWLPNDSFIQELSFNKKFNFNLNQESDIDYSFCYHKQKFRIGKWFKINMDNLITSQLIISVFKTTNCENDIYIDLTNSPKNLLKAECISFVDLDSASKGNNVRIPKIRPKSLTNGEPFYYYIYISITKLCDVDIEVEAIVGKGEDPAPYVNLNQDDITFLHDSVNKTKSVVFPFSSQGVYVYPICFIAQLYKFVVFTVEFQGNYSLLIDGTKINRNNLLEEFLYYENEDGTVSNECVQLWTGKRYGALAGTQNLGVVVKIDGSPNIRYFAILSKDHSSPVEIEFSVVCPDHCGDNDPSGSRGKCSVSDKMCVCNPGYGGDDCHKLCYYNGSWQTDNSDLCFFGEPWCDQYCHCNKGKILKNHLCVSKECLNHKAGSDDEC
ncbi:protein tyrosine kinase domain containing protein, partial [Entamoeba invadens IP1]